MIVFIRFPDAEKNTVQHIIWYWSARCVVSFDVNNTISLQINRLDAIMSRKAIFAHSAAPVTNGIHFQYLLAVHCLVNATFDDSDWVRG